MHIWLGTKYQLTLWMWNQKKKKKKKKLFMSCLFNIRTNACTQQWQEINRRSWPVVLDKVCISNLVFYARPTIAVISGRNIFCYHTVLAKVRQPEFHARNNEVLYKKIFFLINQKDSPYCVIHSVSCECGTCNRCTNRTVLLHHPTKHGNKNRTKMPNQEKAKQNLTWESKRTEPKSNTNGVTHTTENQKA